MNQHTKAALAMMGVLIFFISVIFTIMFYLTAAFEYPKQEACQEIGFEEYKFQNGFQFCVDKDYNLHYIKMVNIGFSKYKAVEISVGDVRVVK